MSSLTTKTKILFAINGASGSNNINYEEEIGAYCRQREDWDASLLLLDGDKLKTQIREAVTKTAPDIVVAVGGDGTIKLVAEQVQQSSMKLGIIAAGSANGMAKELGIPLPVAEALQVIADAHVRPIHLIKVNNQLCIHLSDIGFNAHLIKTFESLNRRGMWGYIKAAWKVLWRHSKMEAKFNIKGQVVRREAVMLVLANATKYGTGVTINPLGSLDDELFELVVIRKISIPEILKMRFSARGFNPEKTEFYQTADVTIRSRRKAHFQVDGEYLGKVNEVVAQIMPGALRVIVPKGDKMLA